MGTMIIISTKITITGIMIIVIIMVIKLIVIVIMLMYTPIFITVSPNFCFLFRYNKREEDTHITFPSLHG